MKCRSCSAENDIDAIYCNYCGSELKEHLKSDIKKVKDEFIQIFITYDVNEAMFIKNLLEGSNVRCLLKDDNLIGLNPMYAGPLGGIKILAITEDIEKAKDIIGEYSGKSWEQDGVGKLSPFDFEKLENTSKSDNVPRFVKISNRAMKWYILFYIALFISMLIYFGVFWSLVEKFGIYERTGRSEKYVDFKLKPFSGTESRNIPAK